MLVFLILITSSLGAQDIGTEKSANKLSSILKIIGGEEVSLGQYPFVLSIEENGEHMCGASALSDYWALTAAHCVVDAPKISLRAGTIFRETNGSIHEVEEIIVHHKFDWSTIDNDIALLKVKTPFSTNPYVKYVKLPLQDEPVIVGSRSFVLGWGLTKPAPEGFYIGGSPILKRAVAKILAKEACEDSPTSLGYTKVTGNMICAQKKGHHAYKGDSGGPLVVRIGKAFKQIGIVSWGDPVGKQAIPCVFVKVSQFRVWIFIKSGV